MSSEPLVSILMPAFNAEKYIQQAIDSILNQTHSNWELLILNDGSADATASVIGKFSDSRIKVYNETDNQGYLASCNQLFTLAEGDFITFLDADDTCLKTRISECVKAIDTNPELGFLTTGFFRTDKLGKPVAHQHTEIDYVKYANEPNYSPIVCCATIFLRMKLLENVGGYHPFFEKIGGEDYHWLFRLSRAGKGSHIIEPLYQYRTHEEQSHHINSNPLKFYFAEIDKEIRTSIIEKNIDLLETDSGLEKLWVEWIEHNPSDLHFRQASSMLNRNEPVKAVLKAIEALIKSPFRFTSWHRLAYLSYSAIMR